LFEDEWSEIDEGNKTVDQINIVEEVERAVQETGGDYISAVLMLAQRLDMDPEAIAHYIKGPIKEKIQLEGEENGLLKRTSRPAARFE